MAAKSATEQPDGERRLVRQSAGLAPANDKEGRLVGAASEAAGLCAATLEFIMIMIKLISTAAIVSFLAACAGVSGSGFVATSNGTSSTATMGAPGAMPPGGPLGSTGGGPN